MRKLVISCIIAAFVIGGLAGAVEAPELPRHNTGEQKKKLTLEEQAALKRRHERFKRLPAEQQERLRRRYEHFKALDPEKRRCCNPASLFR